MDKPHEMCTYCGRLVRDYKNPINGEHHHGIFYCALCNKKAKPLKGSF